MPTKADYRALEREYVTTDVSIRTLARKAGVSFSAVAKWSREHDWPRKREEHRQQAQERSLMTAMEQLSDQMADIRLEAVTAMRATLYAYMENLEQKKLLVGTKEAAEAVRTILLLTGDATERHETIHRDADPLEGKNSDDLRELLGQVRAKRVEGQVVGARTEDPAATRPN